MKILTNSSQKDFRACQRLYQIRHVLGYRPLVDAPALRFGTLLHEMLEHWWLGNPLAPRAVETYDDAKLLALMIGYDARWPRLDVVGVEVPFETSIINPDTGATSRTFRRAGKVDAIVRNPDGRYFIVEHKSAGEDISPGSEYWRRLRIDSQVSTYYAGVTAALGLDVWGCIYDVIKKPTIKPMRATQPGDRKFTKAGTLYANQRDADETPMEYFKRLQEDIASDPDKYYQRAEVVRLEQEVRDHHFDTWQVAAQIRESEKFNRWPRNPDACSRYGRTCDFFDVCTGGASLEDPYVFRKEKPHPELTPKEEGRTNGANDVAGSNEKQQ